MSWDDIFGRNGKKISPVLASIPRDEKDRLKFISNMEKEILEMVGEDIPWQKAIDKLLYGIESGKFLRN